MNPEQRLESKEAGEVTARSISRETKRQWYTVPDGPDGQAGMILNPAGLGGVLDRKRLFTVAIIDELWEHSNG